MMKRVVIYIEEDDYRKLRSLLALRGKSVSEWVRDAVRRFIMT